MGDIRRTRNMSLYSASYAGQQVVVKVLRHSGSMDGRTPSPADPEQHCALLMRLTGISHPNLVNVSGTGVPASGGACLPPCGHARSRGDKARMALPAACGE